MAGPFYVDDGGDGTTETSWATADTNISDLDAEYTFASGEIVYFGADSTDPKTYSGALSIVGPNSVPPVYFISATQGSSPVSYAAASAYQIDIADGAYRLTFSGAFVLYGMWIRAGENIVFSANPPAAFEAHDTRFRVGANGQIIFITNPSRHQLINCEIDLTDDGTTSRANAVFLATVFSNVECTGLTFINPGYRTGAIFAASSGDQIYRVSGCNFSEFGSSCELIDLNINAEAIFTNCITGATWTPTVNTCRTHSKASFYNCGPADAPTYFYEQTAFGAVLSSAAIYRTGGATVETDAISWLVTTTSLASEGIPLKTPYIYGEVSSTGSKTFTVYITNDTADFTDAEVWLDIEYLGTADEANTTLESDHRTITTTAANQTDDTTSTWDGTGPSFTYKQSLAVTATVGETGQYRARVCVGVASIASSRYFYIDPKVTVS